MDYIEDLLEPWSVTVDYRKAPPTQHLMIQTTSRLNLIINTAAATSIADALAFYRALATNSSAVLIQLPSHLP